MKPIYVRYRVREVQYHEQHNVIITGPEEAGRNTHSQARFPDLAFSLPNSIDVEEVRPGRFLLGSFIIDPQQEPARSVAGRSGWGVGVPQPIVDAQLGEEGHGIRIRINAREARVEADSPDGESRSEFLLRSAAAVSNLAIMMLKQAEAARDAEATGSEFEPNEQAAIDLVDGLREEQEHEHADEEDAGYLRRSRPNLRMFDSARGGAVEGIGWAQNPGVGFYGNPQAPVTPPTDAGAGEDDDPEDAAATPVPVTAEDQADIAAARAALEEQRVSGEPNRPWSEVREEIGAEAPEKPDTGA